MHVSSARDVGQLIRANRTNKGWTQADLARKVGSTQRWVSEIENGKATAEIGMVLQTLSMLGIRLEAGTPTPPVYRSAVVPMKDLPSGSDLDDIVDSSSYRP